MISAGNYLLSPNGNCKAVMQGDGNFVIYKGGKAIWCSATITSAYSSYFAVIQTDGNFVIYGQTARLIRQYGQPIQTTEQFQAINISYA